jgi:hypothetical protein
MSDNDYCNLVTRPDKSGKGLSHCEDSVDRTFPIQEADMFGFAFSDLATDLDKSGGLEEN